MTVADVDNVVAARTAAINNLLALELAGPQAWADYSVDGESYQYAAAKRAAQEQIDRLTDLIQKVGGPFIVQTRTR